MAELGWVACLFEVECVEPGIVVDVNLGGGEEETGYLVWVGV